MEPAGPREPATTNIDTKAFDRGAFLSIVRASKGPGNHAGPVRLAGSRLATGFKTSYLGPAELRSGIKIKDGGHVEKTIREVQD